MPWGAVIGAAGSIIGGVIQSNAASNAANAQQNAANAGIAQQQQQFAAIQKLLAPYAQAGTGALGQQQTLLGLNGNAAQAAAIANLQKQPYFQSQLQMGQNAILQNASATGGLRGGNTQGALANFAPNLLAQTVQQQFGNLGGLTGIGENAAAMTGNAGMATGNNITGLLGQIGASQSGGALAQGAIGNNMLSGLLSAFGMYGGGRGGFGGFGGFGGGGATGGTLVSNGATLVGTGGEF